LNATLELVEQLNRRDAATEPDETYQDRSLYEVEVRRVHGGSSAWKGQVEGRPLYFPLPSIDVLAGGTSFKVIDKTGSLKWEAPLSYPLSDRAVASAHFHQPVFERFDRTQFDSQYGLRYRFPFVERADCLYAYDEGVLAAFDLHSGEVKWRVTSVGIRQIMFDREGMLYAGTTLEGPAALGKPTATRKEAPTDALMKIDPASGSVLWTVPYLGTGLFVADKFLYSQWVAETALDRAAALGGNTEVVPTCIIARIDPSSGEVLWQRSYKGDPDTVNVRGSRVLIQFPRRVELLKFFSL
jgi:outer membrane protein assembly factor BamB